jgi:hypothetical protein
MVGWLGRILDKICLFAGALLFSQFPLFIQYYTQQLSGRVDELKWQIDAIHQAALLSGKGIEQYINKFLSSQDADFVLQGQLMQQIISRWHHYSEGLFSLEHATVWMKPILFIQYLDWNVVHSTFGLYEMGLTFNMEGMVFGIIGMMIGCLFSIWVRLSFAFVVSILKRFVFSKAVNNELK